MPTIGIPRTVGNPHPRRDEVRRDDSPSASIKLRMTVAAKRDALTQSLAEGTDPSSSPDLALRASQLTGDRRRREMVKTWRRLIREAIRPSVTRLLVSIVNRRSVLDAEDAIEAMIARLRSPEPVAVKGMAMAERIVTDGLTSPLYNWSEPGALSRLVLVATAELDAQPFELPVAA
jgi:hypothetical protein